MKFGVAIFPTDYTISLAELAPAVESLGFESLWVAEHTHIPVSGDSVRPSGGGELPRRYWHTLDPFVALTQAATVTSRLRIATGVCLVVERDPIITAKEVASLDHLSGGRFIFGIGGGWNREEMRNHGTRFEQRWKLLRERVEAMKAIWAEEKAEYHGDLVDFDAIRSWPKPVQRPHPPIVLGGNAPRTLERVVRYADGWMPNTGDVASRIPELQRMAEEAGRDPIPVSVFPDPSSRAIEPMIEAGAERSIFWLPDSDAGAVLRRLEELASVVRPYTE